MATILSNRTFRIHTYDDQSMQEHNNDHKRLKLFEMIHTRFRHPLATGRRTPGLKIKESIDQPKNIVVGYGFNSPIH